MSSLIPSKLNGSSHDNGELGLVTETGTQQLAMEKQIKQLVEEKIGANKYIVGQLTRVINNAYRCGLLSIEPNKTIVYKSGFGPKKCFNMFCRGVYDKILSNYKGKRGAVIKCLFGHTYVDKVSYSETKKELISSKLEVQVKLIELCINSSKKADFEDAFERIKNK